MRGQVDSQNRLIFIDPESMVPGDHPLRGIKERVDRVLRRLRPRFEQAYSRTGRPSIPPERLIKATLLQALYSIRSERQLCEQMQYNLLFRWFIDLPADEAVWNPSTFTDNRERFARHGLLQAFFTSSVAVAIREEAVSLEHFSVDGTLIEAWASMKSVRPKDGPDDPPEPPGDSNSWKDFRGEKRSNRSHESKTDPEARLAKKSAGQGAILAHSMHVLMENRNGLIADVFVGEANGTEEREAAKEMIRRTRRRHRSLLPRTVGGDRGFDDGRFLHDLERRHRVIPHVAPTSVPVVNRDRNALARKRNQRRSRTRGFQISQRVRKRIEEIFGWLKEVATLRKTRFVGRWKTQMYAFASAAAFNFLRLANLERRATA